MGDDGSFTIEGMLPLAQTGSLTTLLEMAATSIGAGIVVGGFVASGAGMLIGRTRRDLEGNALRSGFWGALIGIFCLCYDLLAR